MQEWISQVAEQIALQFDKIEFDAAKLGRKVLDDSSTPAYATRAFQDALIGGIAELIERNYKDAIAKLGELLKAAPDGEIFPCEPLLCHMTCAECGENMTCDPSWTEETCVGYFSPPGHDHNDNCLSRVYKCPNKHKLKVSLRRTCPACEWKGKDTCFCHPGTKVEEWPE